MTLFSIIVPTRDRPEMLQAAIGSITAQTLQDWELIVIDDGGVRPATVPADDRITIVRNRSSVGPGAARNIGMEKAAGTYIAFLDDDDLWRPYRLQNAAIGHRSSELVICGASTLRDPPRRRRTQIGGARPHPHDWILNTTTPSIGRVTLNRLLCPLFRHEYSAAEDLDWWLRATAPLDSCTVLTTDDWLWRRHEGPRMGIGLEKRIEGSHRLLREHADYFAAHDSARAFRWRRIALMSLELEDFAAAEKAVWESLKARPTIGGVKALAKLAKASLLAHQN